MSIYWSNEKLVRRRFLYYIIIGYISCCMGGMCSMTQSRGRCSTSSKSIYWPQLRRILFPFRSVTMRAVKLLEAGNRKGRSQISIAEDHLLP